MDTNAVTEEPSVALSGKITDAEAQNSAVTADKDEPPYEMVDPEDELDGSDSVSGLKGDPDGLVEEYIGPQTGSSADATSESKPKTKAAPKAKTVKIDLPDGKVKMSAVVKEFTTVPNHFSDNDDEVIVYESVTITGPMSSRLARLGQVTVQR